uniref:Si:dkey-34d22.1 n=1 Tax=Neolamprologus brichardi TaxID=32507 RepID=A0A3Q4G1C4_NEOBR
VLSYSACFVSGNGCGHTLLAPESGTVASQNYPGTYPSNTWCKWRLRVPQGRTLRLLFGDFDVESSPGCSNGSVMITDKNGEHTGKNVTFNSNEVTIMFKSGPHRSGRGFLLSYATDQQPDLISCLQRGSHFSFVYCPAGCQKVTGDVWGNSEHGYRDTSVLCKSAVHAGATSDSLGGHIAVNRGRSLTLYESTFANGVLSKMYVFVFHILNEILWKCLCNNNLAASALNASSFADKNSQEQTKSRNARNNDFSHNFLLWTADSSDQSPWVEMELSDRSTITGIVTAGSDEYYMESYILLFSKDRKNWKLYKDAASKERKVFQAYTDGHLRVLNSLFPPVVARFVRLQPLSWHGRASAQIQVLGCPVSKATPRSSRPPESVCAPRKSSEENYLTEFRATFRISQSRSGCCAEIKLNFCGEKNGAAADRKKTRLLYYAEPALTPIGHKVGSTFKPSSEECYTTPFTCSHYDTPGCLPEYAEPLPPEPEYATPFSDQPSDSSIIPAPTSSHSQYDCPSHRVLFNGYCTPALHANGPRPVSAVYAEPKSCDSLQQKHTYEDPL